MIKLNGSEILSLLKEMNNKLDKILVEKQPFSTNPSPQKAKNHKNGNSLAGELRSMIGEDFFLTEQAIKNITKGLSERGFNGAQPLISKSLTNLVDDKLLLRKGKRGSYKYIMRGGRSHG